MLINIALTMEQVQFLSGIMDAGVKAVGLRAAKGAGELVDIVDDAVKQYNKHLEELAELKKKEVSLEKSND